MSANATTSTPTGRKKLAQGNKVAAASRRSSKEVAPSRDGSATLGNPSPITSSPEGAKEGAMVSLAEFSENRVAQDGPPSRGEFTYVDISSIDRETKRIVDPKVLPVAKAPSRAKQVLKAGDVVVSMTRPNLNAVALVPPNLDGAIGSTGFHVLRAKDVEPGFLFYAVQTTSFIDAMCLKVQGALYPAVRPKDISSFCILPFSLPQQRRIVAEIEKQFTRLEAGVAALRRVQANLKRYRAAVLKAACEGRLVPTEVELRRTADHADGADKKFRKSASSAKSAVNSSGYETGAELLARILTERRQTWLARRSLGEGGQRRGQYKEPAAPDTANLPPLPDGWTWATIEQLSEVVRGSSPRPAGDPRYFGGNVPWITVGPLTADNSPYPIFELLPFVLLENAIKYSPPDESITVSFLEDKHGLQVIVNSIGPQLSEDEHKSLFQRDFRGTNAKKTSDGSGAGLHFAKLVCDLHKIQISARSQRQEKLRLNGVPYSYFTVTLEF